MITQLDEIEFHNQHLKEHYHHKLQINSHLNRQWVSFQANKHLSGYRWYRYKEGFSQALIDYILDALNLENGTILDPFAGVGTTLFAANRRGLNAIGIELLPVGNEVIAVRSLLEGAARESAIQIIQKWLTDSPWRSEISDNKFPHIKITQGAFPVNTETELGRYLLATSKESPENRRILRFAALCVLEEISYTRKDGQYLRWDYRSGRRQGANPFDKGKIYSFEEAITSKLAEILNDIKGNRFLPTLFDSFIETGTTQAFQGSCLEILPSLETASIDGVITSPPYANRYDYTRTYALELAFLGVNETSIKTLRQTMMSCTVENKEKHGLNKLFHQAVYEGAMTAFNGQEELHRILGYLEAQKISKQLNNPGIPRMIRNYFLELSLVIFDCARVLKPNSPLVMVNDNVRYGGAHIPVDLILSSIAEQAGLEVEVIWVLPRGKGNSSQQMGVHGREELRKCVYIWCRRR